MLEVRSAWDSAPPEARSRLDNWPTVLYSWWCTTFAFVIVLTRLVGRKIRSDTLFREDWIMLLSCVPMWIRMVLIHFVLIYGTNNILLTPNMTQQDLRQHSIGSRLVIAARIFYAATIWLNKLTVSEFLKRITVKVWRRSWERALQGIRLFLLVTFIAVVIATLAECRPFDHYWQVNPDPGPACRQGFAQLITMGTCDIVTDILLIAFPIPVVLYSGQHWKRKLQLFSLFSLSIIMIAVTATRMPEVIMHHGRQQFRTVWASSEILASVSVSNAVILGSFLRDKGTKKNKFRNYSVSESAVERTSSRRPTLSTLHRAGSDEELFRSVGVRIPPHLQDDEHALSPRPAPPAPPAQEQLQAPPPHSLHPVTSGSFADFERSSDSSNSDDSLRKPVAPDSSPSRPSNGRTMDLFDVGSLLVDNSSETSPGNHRSHPRDVVTDPGTTALDFATLSPFSSPSSSSSSPPAHPRPGSRTFLRDIGGLLGPNFSRREDRHGDSGALSGSTRSGDESRSRARRQDEATATARSGGRALDRSVAEVSLQDAGGLLRAEQHASDDFSTPLGSQLGGEREITSAGFNFFDALPRPQRPSDSRKRELELSDLGILPAADERDSVD